MISIALCDDEVKYLDYYESKIKEISLKHKLMVETIRFKNGESLLFYLEDHPKKFDIIYLDILTGGITGIDTALAIRKFNEVAKIIFLTSSESYVYNAFDAKATNYLIKNLHDSKFEEIFLSTVKSLNSIHKENINFKSQQGETSFKLSDITHFESHKRLVLVHLNNQTVHEFYYKLSDLTQELENKDFILIHRSFLVNLQYIQKISKNEILLTNHIKLPLSRNLTTVVKSRYMEYLNQRS